MPKTVNVDYVTKTVEIKVNDSETESIAAATAVAAAKNAKDYATSASSSANSAQTTAAALTAWLEDKETLTAPAVDPTLTISGAAADAKVVGNKISAIEDGTSILVQEGCFNANEKLINWQSSNTVRSVKYYADGNYIKLSYNGLSSGINTVSCSFTQASVSDSTIQFETTDYPYIAYRTKSNVPIVDNPKFRLNIFAGSAGTNIDLPIDVGEHEYLINLPETIKNAGINEKRYTTIVPFGIRTAEASYAETPHCSVEYLGKLTKEQGEKYNLKINIERLNAIVSTIENEPQRFSMSAGAYKPLIPSYWTEYPADPVSFSDYSYLDKCGAKIPVNGKKFEFITDTHYWTKNAQKSPQISGYISAKHGVKYCIMGGDIVDFEDNKYKGLNVMRRGYSGFRDVFAEKFYPVLGNHDDNAPLPNQGYTDEEILAMSIPFAELKKELLGTTYDIHICDKSIKVNSLSITSGQKTELKAYINLNYYFDNAEDKIRFIILNTGVPGVIGNPVYEVFGANLGLYCVWDWFFDVLNSVPTGYDVVVAGHAILSQQNAFEPADTQTVRFLNMLTAFLKKTSSYMRYAGDNANMLLWLYGTTTPSTKNILYDFSNAPTIDKLIVICGDGHYDASQVYLGDTETSPYNLYSLTAYNNNVINESTGAFPILMTATDSYRLNGGGSSASSAGRTYNDMEAGTITEQCFDIYTILEDRIKGVRIGAGSDREILIQSPNA